MRTALRLVIVVFTFAGTMSASLAEACVCSATGRSDTCDLYEGAVAVFVGTVRSSGDGDGSPVTFSVDEVFKGVSSATVSIAAYRAADCGPRFEVVDRYLVYASHDQAGNLAVGLCSPTRPLSSASSELRTLREALASGAKTRVGGVVRRMTTLGGPGGGERRVAGMTVILTGADKPFETKTDAAGRYLFEGIPRGRYTVEAVAPGLKRLHDVADLIIGECGTFDESFYMTGPPEIGGTARHLDGSEIALKRTINVMRVDLPMDPDEPMKLVARASVDDNGTWGVDGLPPGRYVVGVNINDVPSRWMPYSPMFYPAATKIDDAEIIELKDGDEVRLDVRLPPPLPARTVSGIIVDESGRPVPGGIRIQDVEDRFGVGRQQNITERERVGTFSHEILAGRRYTIYAQAQVRGQVCESQSVIVPETGEVTGLILVVKPVRQPRPWP